MLTNTFTRLCSASTSSTMPLKPKKWTIDDAHIVALDETNLLARPGRAGIHLLQQRSTSSDDSGIGCAPPPTNPVTFGVSLIICKVSSANGVSISIRT